jgi:FtsP/CotA-like multicopper oxidase with cupredoxin domain
MSTNQSSTPSKDFVPDLEIKLKATEADVAILPGRPTRVWTYRAELLKGDPASVQTLPESYLGPIIRARAGQKVRVFFQNDLPDQPSIVHWHGLRLPEEMDGHPRYAIKPGQTYVYEFAVNDRAGTYWFHPHPDMQTGRQVYNGLAGLFLVSDDEEVAAQLPSDAQDIALVIQDRTFDADNQLIYAAGSAMDGSMDYLMGFLGEQVLVNGRPDYVLDVGTRAYRLRLLNGSNARTYKLAWDDGAPLTVIATDGGLLEQPVERPYVTLAPGERVELWADFSSQKVGAELTLRSLAFEGAEGAEPQPSSSSTSGHDMGGGHGGHQMEASTAESHGGHAMGGHGGHQMEASTAESHGGHDMSAGHGGGHQMGAMASNMAAAPPLGAPMQILTVRVNEQGDSNDALPTVLSQIERYRLADAVNRDRPRTFTLTQPGMRWEINGRAYDMQRPTVDATVKLDDLEVWEIVNARNKGDTMHPMGMAHPFHIHGVQFQVVERQVLPELEAGWQSVREGYVDAGWKDTVLLMPGERVKLLLKFNDFTGTFMYHCHILEHEDMGMMGDYAVVA